MAELTPKLNLPLLVLGQGSGEITHNESLFIVDSLVHLAVKDRDLTIPPSSPNEGDVYLLEARPLTGLWSTFNGIAAQGTLTIGAIVSNGDTMTIDTKVYTFQTVLTDVDGNIEIDASSAIQMQNIKNAITLGGTPGVGYAASTTLHPTVTATLTAPTITVLLTAKIGGTSSSLIATTETFTSGLNVFDGATLGTTRPGADSLVVFRGGVWVEIIVKEGFVFWVIDEDKFLVFDGLVYQEQSFSSTSVISDNTDVNTAGAVSGNVLEFNGTIWVPGIGGGGGSASIFFGGFQRVEMGSIENSDLLLDGSQNWLDRYINVDVLWSRDLTTSNNFDIQPTGAEESHASVVHAQQAADGVNSAIPFLLGGQDAKRFNANDVGMHAVLCSFYSAAGKAAIPDMGTVDVANISNMANFKSSVPAVKVGIYVNDVGELRLVWNNGPNLSSVINVYFNVRGGPDLGGYA